MGSNSFMLTLVRCGFLFLCVALAGTVHAQAQNGPKSRSAQSHSRAAQRAAAAAAKVPEGEFKNACKRDKCLHLDARGKPLYVCNHGPVAEVTAGQPTEPYVATATFPLADTFKLHSRPGARRIIYLDFDGHTTRGTSWNSGFTAGADIISPPFNTDGNAGAFSDAERTAVQDIWRRVAEDFAPFDVDVTTEDPGAAALSYSGTSDANWGIRVVVGGSSSDWLGAGAGGVAYLNSYTASNDTPCFVFPLSLGNNAKYIAEAASHEVGHTVGLYHSSQSNGTEYYAGHADWAPIMGVGYYKAVTQWSKGDYPSSNNTQDNLAVIAQYIPLLTAPGVQSLPGAAGSAGGVLARPTQVDAYTFSAGPGAVSFNAQVAVPSPNLKASLSLRDASGLVLATSSSAGMGATLSTSVTGGTYTLSVDGVGTGDALTAYTDYGSLGRYLVSGSWPALEVGNQLPIASTTGTNPTSGTAPLTVQFNGSNSSDPDGIIAGYSWDFGNGTTSSFATPAVTYSAAGNYTATLTVTDNSGATASSTVVIAVASAPTSDKFVRVGSLNLVWSSSRKGVKGVATVRVTDAAGKILPNVAVEGTFSGIVSSTVRGTSNRKGQVSFSSPSFGSNTRGTLTFSVTKLTLSGYVYDASVNIATTRSISR